MLSGAAFVVVFALYYGGLYVAAPLFYPPERIVYELIEVHFVGVMLCFVPAGMVVLTSALAAALASERYTITTEHVEVRRGLVNRYTKLIPFTSVRDGATVATLDQRLYGLSNVNVIASNGDTISLQDVPDHEAKRDLIWSLVPR